MFIRTLSSSKEFRLYDIFLLKMNILVTKIHESLVIVSRRPTFYVFSLSISHVEQQNKTYSVVLKLYLKAKC